MAATEVTMPSGARAKVRDPGLVLLWSILTLSIYTYVWYYRINREMRDFGRAHGDDELAKSNPTLSILAVTLGALVIVPALVSYWRTTGRIRRVQRACSAELTEGWIIAVCYVGGLLFLLPLLVIPPYVQSGLNRVWRLYPAAEGAPEVTPPPAAAEPEASPPPPPDPSQRLG